MSDDLALNRRRALVVPDLGLGSVPEIANLRIERTLEGRPRRATFDVGGEALFACDDVGVL